MKEHQISWAHQNRLSEFLENRKNKTPSWVLKKGYQSRNLRDPSWWQYIEGREHKWARSLLSSQCFALNIFGPLAGRPVLAKQVLADLLPHQTLEKNDEVTVHFEHTPEQAPAWLGEIRQPTQVDVCFIVRRFNNLIGYLLIEVKFTETEFGSCRGAKKSTLKRPGNPNPSRCEDLPSVIANPKEHCWMVSAKENGRRYWEYMLSPNAPFRFPTKAPCPFSHSLYQLMRNQVLAIALVQERAAEWADFRVCLHPANTLVRQLPAPIGSHTDALQAFNNLLTTSPILEIDPLRVVDLVRKNDSGCSEWADWVISRYDLSKS